MKMMTLPPLVCALIRLRLSLNPTPFPTLLLLEILHGQARQNCVAINPVVPLIAVASLLSEAVLITALILLADNSNIVRSTWFLHPIMRTMMLLFVLVCPHFCPVRLPHEGYRNKILSRLPWAALERGHPHSDWSLNPLQWVKRAVRRKILRHLRLLSGRSDQIRYRNLWRLERHPLPPKLNDDQVPLKTVARLAGAVGLIWQIQQAVRHL